GVSGDLRERSIHHGRALGAAVLAWAATDGFFATRDSAWKPPADRALWVNTVTTDQFVPQLLSGESDIVLAGNPNSALDLERASARDVFTNRPKAARKGSTLGSFNPVRPTEPYWGSLRTFAIR